MRKATAFILLTVIFSQPAALAGLGKTKAKYMGGTVTDIREKQEGRFDLTDEEKLIFHWKKGEWELPYDRIRSLEYGQKAGRRVGVAIAVTWVALFSKKRKHFLTIGFTDDEGKDQAAVFELGKKITKKTLVILETRSEAEIEYESEDARKHVHG